MAVKRYNGTDWVTEAGGVPALPSGMLSPYAGSSAPTGWLLCAGQTLNSITTPEYAALWAVIGTTYGGTGSSSFNLPDLRGRVPAALDNMGGTDAGRLSLANTLGTTAGTQTHLLTSAEIPAHSHPNALSSNTVASSSHRHDFAIALLDNNYAAVGPNGAMNATGTGQAGAYRYSNSTFTGAAASTAFSVIVPTPGSTTTANATRMISYGDTNTPSATTTVGITNADNTGGGGAHNNMQPTILLNYIIKV
jgi:microcystin-dependent protein